jgi:tRNA(Arg) A34 adenosine deaminase TadA
MNDEQWMQLAINTARAGITAGQSPFGACIVRGSELITAAHNIVLASTDITAHAEVTAIRKACEKLGTIHLPGCTIYSTCEPCPMCFSAIHWARFDRIVFGATIPDAQASGFCELGISNEQMKQLGGSRVEIVPGFLAAEARGLFAMWKKLGGQSY